MTPGSVIVDAAIDQGGSIETIDRVTPHSDPKIFPNSLQRLKLAGSFCTQKYPGSVPFL